MTDRIGFAGLADVEHEGFEDDEGEEEEEDVGMVRAVCCLFKYTSQTP